jgi:RNA polymerase sigma factor (sigma-70 family)
MDKRSAGREEARVLRLGGPRHFHDHVPTTELRTDLMEALRTLPIRQQAAIVLSYWADLPEADIAEALGCRPGTVKSTLSRALDNLRKVIGDD